MPRRNRTIFKLSTADVQHVARKEFGRVLTEEELRAVEDKVGDYIEWYDVIDATIDVILNLPRNPAPDEDDD